MNPEAYVQMAASEASHWWYRGRRAIVSEMITSLALPQEARILEIGCGTGGNLAMLAAHGDVCAVEMNPAACSVARGQAGGPFDVREGRVPGLFPFRDNQFDLMCMLDVLEHIDPDVDALRSLRPHLSRGARVLVTVPAYQWLYGPHDVVLHHKRRYSAKSLQRTAEAAGFAVRRLTYFNAVTFPLAVVVRGVEKLSPGKGGIGVGVPPHPVNRLLEWLFMSELPLLKRADLPFGLSLLCVLEAND